MKEVGLALALLAMLASVAHAEPIDGGTITLDAGLGTEDPSRSVGDVQAAFWSTTAGLRELSVGASRLRVTIFEFDQLDTLFVQHSIGDRGRSYEVTDAAVTLTERGRDGWVGIYGGAASVNDIEAGPLDAVATIGPIGNADQPVHGAPDSRFPLFSFTSSEPYLRVDGAVSLARSGDLTLKLVGPTIRVHSRENDTTLWTGSRPHETIPGRTTSRWIVLSATDALANVASDDPASLALRALHLETNGTIQLRQATGEIELPEGRYLAEKDDAAIAGRLIVDLAPRPAESAPTLVALVGGDLGSSTLAFTRVAATPGDRVWPLVAGALLVTGILGVVVLAATRRRGETTQVFSVDEYVDLASRAADEGRYGDALSWTQRARALAPTSARLILDEGTYHERMGDVAKAIDCYMQASRASNTGEADYLTALLLHQTSGAHDEIAEHLIEALRRTPALALELEDDPPFGRLLERPDLRRAVASALRDLET